MLEGTSNRYDEEANQMDPGGIVQAEGGDGAGGGGTKPKRARKGGLGGVKPTGGTGSGAKGGGGGYIYLLVNKDGHAETLTGQEAIENGAARAIIDRDTYKLYRAEEVTPQSVFQN